MRVGGRECYLRHTFGDVDVVFRPPQLVDAARWRDARLAQQAHLDPVFGVDDWAAAHTDLAWVERCLRLRHAARRTGAVPGVLIAGEQLIGEVGIDAVDVRTGTGELSFWLAAGSGAAGAGTWTATWLCLHAFTSAPAMRRVVAPVACGNGPAERLVTRVGFACEIVHRDYLPFGGELADHGLWVLHNMADNRARLAASLADAGIETSVRRS